MKWCFSSYCSLKCQEKKRLILSFNVICLLWTYIVKELLTTDKYPQAVLPLQDQPQRGVNKMAWPPHAHPSIVQRKGRETYLLGTGIYFRVFY